MVCRFTPALRASSPVRMSRIVNPIPQYRASRIIPFSEVLGELRLCSGRKLWKHYRSGMIYFALLGFARHQACLGLGRTSRRLRGFPIKKTNQRTTGQSAGIHATTEFESL